jgi:hypothetical protein
VNTATTLHRTIGSSSQRSAFSGWPFENVRHSTACLALTCAANYSETMTEHEMTISAFQCSEFRHFSRVGAGFPPELTGRENMFLNKG